MAGMKNQVKQYFSQSHNLLTSLVLVLPLLILYQVGLLLVGDDALNGVDFVSVLLVRLTDGPLGLIIFNLVLLLLLFIGTWHLRRKQKFDPGFFAPMLVESAAYALFLGVVIVFIMQHTMPMAGPAFEQLGWLTKVTISLGAGVYEELLFRLVLISLLTYVFVKWVKVQKGTALFGAFLISAFLFSLAHYIGAQVEAYGFVYRFIAGLIFAVLFKFRSFAIAVYTHAFYDIFVLFSG